MTQTTASPITRGEDKLQRLIDRLGIELCFGQRHLLLSTRLADDLDKKPDAWALASHFWLLTIKSHGDAAVLALARLFETRKDTVNLHALLDCADKTPGLFTTCAPCEVRQLVEKQRRIMAELTPRLGPIMDRRNKVLAHLDAASSPSDWKVGLGDLSSLYERGRDVLNTVSTAYKGEGAMLYWSPERDQLWSDYRSILG